MPALKPTNGAFKVTAEMLRLYRLVMAIKAADGDLEWEPDGRRREYLEVSGKLHDLLGLQLWDLPVTSDNVYTDEVSWPVLCALDDADRAQDAAVGPPVRRIEEGLSIPSDENKRMGEAVRRARAG